jgi:hypothetical protein
MGNIQVDKPEPALVHKLVVEQQYIEVVELHKAQQLVEVAVLQLGHRDLLQKVD